MQRFAFALLCLLGVSNCGKETETPRRAARSGADVSPISLPLAPTPVTTPAPVTTPTAPGGVTGAVALVGPALPDRAQVVRLRARLDIGATPGVTTLRSTHPGEAFDSVAVPTGPVTLVYLDEAGNATPFQTQVQVAAGTLVQVPVGAVGVASTSVVHPERSGTQALTYRIGQGAQTLKNVLADLNTVVDLPPGPWEWRGSGQGGELPAVTLTARGLTFVDREWGSVFVRKAVADTVTLRSAAGVVLFGQTTDGVEYLLPATDQTHGCMVYLGVVNQLTTDTITLCQDAILHADLRAR